MKGKHRVYAFLLSLLCNLAFLGFLGTDVAAERVRTAIPQANLNYLSIYVTEAKGFFKAEGIEHETVVIAGPTGTAALLSGDVDYSGAGGSGMRAATKGAPIKGIMFQTEKVTFYLVTEPSITKVTDLKGKKIAVGTLGDTQDTLMTMFAERGGLSARDIIRIAMGPNTATRLAAIKSGAASATTMDPAGVVLSEKEGLRTMAYLGDLFPFPFQGFAVTDRKIADNPGQIKRWLRAMIKGLMYVRDNPEEATEIGMKKLQLGNINKAMLLASLKRYLKALPEGVPGLPSPEGIKNVLEYDIRIPMNIREEIPPEKVLSLKFVEEVKRELESIAPTR